MRTSQTVALLGDWSAGWADPVRRQIRELQPRLVVEEGDCLEAWLGEAPNRPAVVCLARGWPDEWPEGTFLRLFEAFPLSRFLVCDGPWCASVGRTRDLWPAAICVPADRAVERLIRELECFADDAPFLPLTASRDEVFAFDFPAPQRSADEPRRVRVDSPDRAYREMLVQFLGQLGHHPISGGEADADCLLFDVDPWTGARQRQLARILGQEETAAELPPDHTSVVLLHGGYEDALTSLAGAPADHCRALSKLASLTRLASLISQENPAEYHNPTRQRGPHADLPL